MVRLKSSYEQDYLNCWSGFQFLYGTIKMLSFDFDNEGEIVFQFLYGTIKMPRSKTN